jgi:hypothetical protein
MLTNPNRVYSTRISSVFSCNVSMLSRLIGLNIKYKHTLVLKIIGYVAGQVMVSKTIKSGSLPGWPANK